MTMIVFILAPPLSFVSNPDSSTHLWLSIIANSFRTTDYSLMPQALALQGLEIDLR